MLRILDNITENDTSDTIADVNYAAFVHAHGHLLSKRALEQCTLEASRENWKKYPNPRNVYGFAYRDEELVGFVVAGTCRQAGLQSFAEIFSLYVHPSFHHRGIGSALLNWGIEHLRERANGSVYVTVVSENMARNFYLRTGAQYIETMRRDVFGDTLRMDVLCYTLA